MRKIPADYRIPDQSLYILLQHSVIWICCWWLILQILGTDPWAPINHNVFNASETPDEPVLVKEKPGTLLDRITQRTATTTKSNTPMVSNIWHLRLFTVLKPLQQNVLDHNLWSSEDMTLLFFPKNAKIQFTKGPIEYSDLMEYPMLERYYTNHNMLTPIIEMINHRHRPKFLLLAVKELPENFQPVVYDFPIIVCDVSPFKNYPEEFLCFNGGEDVKVFQVVLDVGDSRATRDEKIQALRHCCGPAIRDSKAQAKDAADLQTTFQINQV